MTFEEMMQRAMFQYNADWDDREDYDPHLDGYVNEGYDLLLYALTEHHLDDLPIFHTLVADTDANEVPKVPQWTHLPLCDYATYLLYRNGNPQKQQRGQEYLRNFLQCLSKCEDLRGKVTVDEETGTITVSGDNPQFINYWP